LKKILIFIDWFLPGYKAGGPISSNANLVDHLKDDYEFYIITRDTDYCETTPYANIIPDTWNTLSNGAKVYYISSKNLSLRNLVKISKTISFDLVYINGMYSPYFSVFPLFWFKYFTRKKIVVSGRGMLSDHTFSSKKGKKRLFYTFAWLFGLYKGIVFHATNEEEAQQIRKNAGFKGEIKVAPNLPPKINNSENYFIEKRAGELRLISIARVSPEKNTLFALNVLEQCSKQLISTLITYDLYGTIYNPTYWNECLQVIERLPSNIKVNFYGPLEKEKIQETLCKYHFLFMPSQGENYGHSMVESMLAGRPVIISDQTPWKNLQQIAAGWDLPLDKPNLFVEAIEYCSGMEQETYNTLQKNVLGYALKITQDPKVIEANKKLFVS
jgi:glycosyltransferase involved in cell wall biosynthesis